MAAYAITPHQQARIRKAAEHFLARHPRYQHKYLLRFDAIFCCPGKWPRHLPGAWS